MGLKHIDDLVELTDSRRVLIDYLYPKKEKSIYDIRRKLDISQRRVNQIISELNDDGIIGHHRKPNHVTTHFIRDNNKIIVKHEIDKFLPDMILIIGIIFSSIFISLYFIMSLKFMVGALFSMVLVFVMVIYKILKTPNVKHYFYKKGNR